MKWESWSNIYGKACSRYSFTLLVTEDPLSFKQFDLQSFHIKSLFIVSNLNNSSSWYYTSFFIWVQIHSDSEYCKSVPTWGSRIYMLPSPTLSPFPPHHLFLISLFNWTDTKPLAIQFPCHSENGVKSHNRHKERKRVGWCAPTGHLDHVQHRALGRAAEPRALIVLALWRGSSQWKW